MAPTMIGGVPHHKIVMITGVSRGLGRALSLELASQGHTIIGCARSQDKLDTLMEELPRKFQQNHLLTNLDVVRIQFILPNPKWILPDFNLRFGLVV